ncbi:MAG: DUF3352 domain-containing protein [Bryobacterales bacterium]|nr:DUF3352 domain-containing protein [Bryobacterales bacterium]
MRVLPLLCLATAAAFAQPISHPTFWRYVHPQAKTLIGIDLRAVSQSPLWNKIAADFEKSGWKQQVSHQGLDFVKDIDQILLSSPSLPSNARQLEGAAVVLAMQGRFQLDKLRSSISAKGAKTSSYKGVPLLLQDGKTDIVLAMVSPQLLVLGDPKSLRAAIDHHETSITAMAGEPRFQRATELATLYDAWIVSDAPPAAGPQSPAAQMLKDVRGFEGGISLRDGLALELNLQTDSHAKARELTDGLRVLLQFATMGPQQDPMVRDLVQRLRIQTDDSRASFAILWKQDEVVGMVDGLKAKAVQAAFGSPNGPLPAAPTLPEPAPKPPAGPLIVKIFGMEEGPREVVIRRE